MSFPASLTTRTVKGRFVTVPDGIAARGWVRIVLDEPMQGSVDAAIVAPFDWTIRLVDGNFSVILPATNDPQWNPVYFRLIIGINGADSIRTTFTVPYDSTEDLDITDVLNLPTPTPGEAYILLSSKGVAGGIASLGQDGKVPSSQLPTGVGGSVSWTDVTSKPSVFPADPATVSVGWTSVTGKPTTFPHDEVTWDQVTTKPTTFTPSAHTHTIANVTGLQNALDGKAPAGGGGGSGGPAAFGLLFNVEDYGAVGDGVTDDYPAFLAAWNAMLASSMGGRVFLPRAVEYRIDATVSGRMTPDSNGTYALFKLPYVHPVAASPKVRYGIIGVGAPYSPREFPFLGGTPATTMTSSVMKVTYSTPFTWSSSNGLPSIIAAPDADHGSAVTGSFWFTNLHFTADNVTIRQPNNPSMACLNLETVSTASLGEVAFDVDVPLDSVDEPTHPTGVAVLMPRVQNNVTATIDKILVQGYYAAVPFVEHIDVQSAIVLRSKIAVHFRRNGYHFGHMSTLSIEQCPFGLAGYDPSGAPPNLGVVPIPTECVVKIDFADFEDTNYAGAVHWMYAPGAGAHVYDPNNKLYGQMTAASNDVDGVGDTDSLWVIGAIHFSIFGLRQWSPDGSTRHDAGAHVPVNPPSGPPNTPTIGVATAGDASASVTFTPAGSGQTATSFTVTSSPSNITGTGSSSPITVNGLTNDTAYTFTVTANNSGGSSAASSASNSVTPVASGGGGPTPGTTIVHDTFNRADADAVLGTSDTGQVWSTGTNWGIQSNAARFKSTGSGGNYVPVVIDAGVANCTVTAKMLPLASVGEDYGLILRYVDASNYVFVDFGGSDSGGWVSRTFERVGGTLTGVTTLVHMTDASSTTPPTFKAVMNGATITMSYNVGAGDVALGSFTNNTALRSATKFGLVSESGQDTSHVDEFLIVS